MQLTRPRQNALAELVRLLGRGLVQGADADAMLDLIARAAGVQAVAVGEQPHVGGWQRGHGIPTWWPAAHARAPHLDPTGPLLVAAPPGTWHLQRRDGDGDAALARCHREAAFTDRAVARLRNPFLPTLFVALYRGVGARPFDDGDLALLELLYPHLAGSLASRRTLALLGHPTTARTESGATLDITWPRVATQADVRWTPEARRLWRRLVDGANPRTSSDQGEAWDRIDQLVVRAGSRFCAVDGRSQLVVPGVRIEFVDAGAQDGQLRRLRGLVLEEGAAPSPVETPASALLSTRQRQIARLAATGGSSADIAAALGIRPETARSHLKAIYGRLGVSSRVELARLLFDGQA